MGAKLTNEKPVLIYPGTVVAIGAFAFETCTATTLLQLAKKMASTQDERFAFTVEWYDQQAAMVRRYQLLFYVTDNTIELFDIKNRRQFLKRSKTDVQLGDLYIGSAVHIHSRQFKFIDYGDEYTRRKLCTKKEKTLGMIKPDAVDKVGDIISAIFESGFLISKIKMCMLSRPEAGQFYEEHQKKSFYNQLVQFMSSGPIIAFEIVGENAIQRWRDLIGPTDSNAARAENPTSLRARFGTDGTCNAVHGSDSSDTAAREIQFFFSNTGPTRMNTATYSDCTCCVIKPHAVLNGSAGQIIRDIKTAGFEISALQMFHVERANAEEFLEVYKGVVQEYPQLVDQMAAGPCIALEIRAENAPEKFREMCGPHDPEIARQLRPRTLRAKYGKDKVQNAVHCPDLPEDAILEVEYFFKILDQ